jgi:hypothetical protein
MKTALKIGFSTTTQYWKSTLLHSKFLIFTFILITLLESFLLHEGSQILSSLTRGSDYSRSIINVDVLDFSNASGSLVSYLLTLSRSYLYEFIIINSFFLGVYYYHTGFYEQGKTSPSLDNVLDVPINQTQRPTLDRVLQYINKETRIYYLKGILLFLVVQFFGGVVGNSLYDLFTFAGELFYSLFRLTPYLLLLFLYLKWLEIPFSEFWKNKDKWLLIIICGILVPSMGWYIWKIINSILDILTDAVSNFVEVALLFQFLGEIAYYMLLIPFISIFYSQTLIYFKNEQEA